MAKPISKPALKTPQGHSPTMRVAKLLALLRACDPDAEVFFHSRAVNKNFPIVDVESREGAGSWLGLSIQGRRASVRLSDMTFLDCAKSLGLRTTNGKKPYPRISRIRAD